VPPDSTSTRLLLTEVINSLILISADKVKLIFKQNIQILSTLIRRWRQLVAVNRNVLVKMLSIPDSEAENHLWKMNAIEVSALAVCYGVPVLARPEEGAHLPLRDRKFQL
jgi:hypothetical protein